MVREVAFSKAAGLLAAPARMAHRESIGLTGRANSPSLCGFNGAGARGDGVTDDSAAINRAIAVGRAVKFSAKIYGLAGPIYKPSTAVFYSDKGAVLKALQPGLTGVVIGGGLSTVVHTLPSLVGFERAVQATGTVRAANSTA